MLFKYLCPKCDKKDILQRTGISDEICPTCGRKMVKAFAKGGVNIRRDVYSKPLVSSSLAVAPSQIEEHRKMFPDVGVREDGCLIFDRFTTHEDYLHKTGFVKQTQKIKPRGKRICQH